ncbi:PAS domain-containing protein [Parerythrobacter lacustris]|uniref:PAS domain-containing protein n=1 Tax=Parerythrobacter lacustris TaxID=2969984 RepID=UPI003F4F766B
MDTLRGNFGLTGESDDERNWDSGEDEIGRELPPAAIGTDERRMQVRAYNHWASLLADRAFPSIEDLEPENLPDFGPFSVLLDFTAGIEDPAIQYIGRELGEECGADIAIERLSDVPSRSLLSRITDHYMQILANQAPIGFEAEFVNQRDATILYRGILLPYSSDGETIDFIYGVINWKEMADQITSDELLLEIDQALDHDVIADGEDASVLEASLDDIAPPPVDLADATDWADGPGGGIADLAPVATGEAELDESEWPVPQFGLDSEDSAGAWLDDDDWSDAGHDPAAIVGEDAGKYAVDYGNSPDEDEECEEDDAVVSRLSSLIAPRTVTRDAFEEDEDEDDFGDQPMFAPRSPLLTKKQALPPVEDSVVRAQVSFGRPSFEDEPGTAAEPFDLDETFEPPVAHGDALETGANPGFVEAGSQLDDVSEAMAIVPDPQAGLYDCLAEARELALAAHSSEDRSRSALYAAVSRAYDVCLAAEDDPEEFSELVAESGLTTQDRAPMTPVVKLVFGVDYDKTRLAEYASVLAHARRLSVGRGELAGFLTQAEGGLKGVVQTERRLRKEEAGKAVAPADAVRPSLAKKLRKLETRELADLSSEGAEFGVVMIRRLEDGSIAVLGEISDDIALVEKVARKLV